MDDPGHRRSYDDSDVTNFASAQSLRDKLLRTIIQDRQKQFQELEQSSGLAPNGGFRTSSAADYIESPHLHQQHDEDEEDDDTGNNNNNNNNNNSTDIRQHDKKEAAIDRLVGNGASGSLRPGGIPEPGRDNSLLGAMLGQDAAARTSYDDQDMESLSLTRNLHNSILKSIMKDQTGGGSSGNIGRNNSGSYDDEASMVQDVGSQHGSVYASLSPRHEPGKALLDGPSPPQQLLGAFENMGSLLTTSASTTLMDVPRQPSPIPDGTRGRRYSSFTATAARTDPDGLLDALHLSAPLDAPKNSRKKSIRIVALPPPPPLSATKLDDTSRDNSKSKSKTSTETADSKSKRKKKSKTKKQKSLRKVKPESDESEESPRQRGTSHSKSSRKLKGKGKEKGDNLDGADGGSSSRRKSHKKSTSMIANADVSPKQTKPRKIK